MRQNVAAVERLERKGWTRVDGKGDHVKFKHPKRAGHVVVPHQERTLRSARCGSPSRWRRPLRAASMHTRRSRGKGVPDFLHGQRRRRWAKRCRGRLISPNLLRNLGENVNARDLLTK
ncbi:MAG: type II toxin-antitoxin system HicA family toxin [Nitrococcus sp.]|nr:type II toxin-antitoxin system HicA family toxin [Nitrococcus sp.]